MPLWRFTSLSFSQTIKTDISVRLVILVSGHHIRLLGYPSISRTSALASSHIVNNQVVVSRNESYQPASRQLMPYEYSMRNLTLQSVNHIEHRRHYSILSPLLTPTTLEGQRSFASNQQRHWHKALYYHIINFITYAYHNNFKQLQITRLTMGRAHHHWLKVGYRSKS
jgi:hypothetical protein